MLNGFGRARNPDINSYLPRFLLIFQRTYLAASFGFPRQFSSVLQNVQALRDQTLMLLHATADGKREINGDGMKILYLQRIAAERRDVCKTRRVNVLFFLIKQ